MTEQEELIRLRTLLAAKDKVIAEQETLIKKQQIQIDNMIQALLHARKKLFGSSSEKTPRKSGVREEMLAGIPKEIEEYIIHEGEVCPKCGGDLIIIGFAGHVPEIYDGSAIEQTGKRLVWNGTGAYQGRHGILGDALQ